MFQEVITALLPSNCGQFLFIG
jgi:WD40 repeat protein